MNNKLIISLLFTCTSSLLATSFSDQLINQKNSLPNDLSIAIQVGWEVGIIDYKYHAKEGKASGQVLYFCPQEVYSIINILQPYRINISVGASTSYEVFLEKVNSYITQLDGSFQIARAIGYLNAELIDNTPPKRILI